MQVVDRDAWSLDRKVHERVEVFVCPHDKYLDLDGVWKRGVAVSFKVKGTYLGKENMTVVLRANEVQALISALQEMLEVD